MKEVRPFLTIGSAAAAFLSYPPFPLGPLIFLALAPLFYIIEDLSPHDAFMPGFLWGIVYNLGLVYYIGWVTVPGMLATVLILALIPATACWFFVKLLDRSRSLALIFMPSYLLAWNWLLTKSELNYPWTDFGYALSYFRPMIQAAEIAGVYLISLVILAVNMMVYVSISPKLNLGQRKQNNLRYLSALLIVLLYAYGSVRLESENQPHKGEKLRVGLIQGNVTKDIKWEAESLVISFQRYFNLSRQAARDGAQLIIWPETAMPTYLAQEPHNLDYVKSFVDSLNVPVLTGVVYYRTIGPSQYVYYNSAILLKPSEPGYTLYSKNHLVPMSERIPYSGEFRILNDIHLGQADFSRGAEMTVFNSNRSKYSTLICFESAFPGYAREFVRSGAQFLVVITNDMWFGRTSLYEQHAMMSVFRAVENRVPVVRAANTGITMAVDKWGRILGRTGIFTEDYLIVDIQPEISHSLYQRIGDIIPQGATIVSLLSMAFALWPRRKYIGGALC